MKRSAGLAEKTEKGWIEKWIKWQPLRAAFLKAEQVWLDLGKICWLRLDLSGDFDVSWRNYTALLRTAQ